MKITGIITEYNPFHNGHKYQIDKVKETCDAIVAVMSGNFVQRGDVAIFDKFLRAECAVRCGVDLVIELPCVYSLSTAQRFASGGVATLDSLGVIDNLCFGSENGDISALISASDILDNEPPEISEKIRTMISAGISYPSARQKAFENIINSDILSMPNNILAIEYIRALKSIKSSITPITIKRHIADYHDTEPTLNFASATAVRNLLNKNHDISRYVPENICDIYKSANISDKEHLFPMLYHTIRSGGADILSKIADVSEGLENRIYKECGRVRSITELAEAIKTKRYTMSRINRILMCIILGITDELCTYSPQYIRILAMNNTGAKIISSAKKKCRLPIITKPASFSEKSDIWTCEQLAADISSVAFGKYGFNNELIHSPVFIDE